MKLFSLPASPFAARCRMMIYAKNLPVEIVAPPGGPRSDAFEAISPMRKVPALDTGEGVIPESDTIVEFLEDHFPEPPMRPATSLQRSKARLLSRIADLYIMEPMFPLFMMMRMASPDPDAKARQLDRIDWGLRSLDWYLDGKTGYAVGDRLSTADCTLVPTLVYVTTMLPRFGNDKPLNFRDKIAAYWEAIQQDPVASRVIGEIREGMAEMRAASS
jgi:glutathione S-transferase